MLNAKIFYFLSVFVCTIYGQWITEKSHAHAIVDRKEDYWYIRTNGICNRPTFPAYIHFYNKHTAKSEYSVDCSQSPLILYHKGDIIFRTTGHLWSEGDSYYVTIDEGVLYSNNVENSTESLHPNFWQFHVVRPLHTQ